MCFAASVLPRDPTAWSSRRPAMMEERFDRNAVMISNTAVTPSRSGKSPTPLRDRALFKDVSDDCYFTTMGLYFGTRAFMMLHASTYAIPQKQNMMK